VRPPRSPRPLALIRRTSLSQLSHDVCGRFCVSFLTAHSFFNPRRILKNGALDASAFRRFGCAMLALATTR
jgi:hypothetical protein